MILKSNKNIYHADVPDQASANCVDDGASGRVATVRAGKQELPIDRNDDHDGEIPQAILAILALTATHNREAPPGNKQAG